MVASVAAVVIHGVVSRRRGAALELLCEAIALFAHLGVAEMHLAEEVVGETAVVVEAREVCAADVADLQFLVSRRARGVRESLELTFLVLLLNLQQPDAMELLHCHVHCSYFSHDLHLGQGCFDALGELVDSFEKRIGLADLVGCFFEASLCLIDSAVAFGDEFADVAPVVELEAPVALLRLGGCLVFFAQVRLVCLRARSQVLLGVGEEVVRAGADQVGAAHLGVGDRERWLFGGGAWHAHEVVPHELLQQLSLLGGHGVRVCVVAVW